MTRSDLQGYVLATMACAALSCGTVSKGTGSGPTESVQLVAPFQVTNAAGTPYDQPFLGGLNVPRPQFVDIDGDGDFDLFLQENPGSVSFHENVGTPTAARFAWRTDRFEDLELGDWFRFVDIDGDGDADLFTERRYSPLVST